jgi:thymidine kinase
MITHYNYIANATQLVNLAHLDPEVEEKTKTACVSLPRNAATESFSPSKNLVSISEKIKAIVF